MPTTILHLIIRAQQTGSLEQCFPPSESVNECDDNIRLHSENKNLSPLPLLQCPTYPLKHTTVCIQITLSCYMSRISEPRVPYFPHSDIPLTLHLHHGGIELSLSSHSYLIPYHCWTCSRPIPYRYMILSLLLPYEYRLSFHGSAWVSARITPVSDCFSAHMTLV